MNSYFELTGTPGRRRPPLFPELGFHPQLPDLLLQLPEPGPLRDRQRRLVASVLGLVLVHPVPECTLLHPNLTGDLGDRTRRLDHHLHRLVLELRSETPTQLRHPLTSIPDQDPIRSAV